MSPTRALRSVALVLVPVAAVLLLASPAIACGGLVGENGTITLLRTSTLAAYHDGVERYVTSFEFTGEGEEVGSIVPLPDVPTKIERGGDWTLQRLQQEIAVEEPAFATAGVAADGALRQAKVLATAKVDALDITILEGGGDEVGKWALDNGFFLTPDAPEVLDFYAERSPIFMAAKFDASRAARLGQASGDGTPIMLTIPTDDPWVPLRILGLGLDAEKQVEADVFVLTDQKPKLLAGGPGLALGRDEPATDLLLDDLRSDKGMEWVPNDMWFTHLPLAVAAGELDYDLAISARSDSTALPSIVDAGVTASEARAVTLPGDGFEWWPWLAGLCAAAVVWFLVDTTNRLRRPRSPQS